MRFLLLAVALVQLALPGRAQRPPNILFLFADDQRSDTIAALGNEHIETPNLDALVHRGFAFRRNYCMGSMHGAVCQPSRAMVMTGRSLYRVRMDLKDTPTLPELLRARGYTTFMTGKWHNGGASCRRSFDDGRAIMLGGMANHAAVPVRDFDPAGGFTPRRTGERFSSELFADAAIGFLKRQRHAKRPFFAYVAFTAPHDPRQPPDRWREYYYEHRPPLPTNFLPQHPFDNGWMVGRDEMLAPWPRTPEVIGDQLAEYYGMISHLDEQVGRVLDALAEAGHADDTIVVYAADHGLALGSHGLLGKQSVYEVAMGCPLVLAGPSIPHGQSQALTYLLDLFPTLCALAGTDPGKEIAGASLLPVVRGERAAVRKTLYLTFSNKMRAVRDGRYKLIRYPLIDRTQLFDLRADPDERHDLAAAPEQAERIAALMQRLADWQQRVGDPDPLQVDQPRSDVIDLTGHTRKPDRWQPQWIVDKYFGDHSK